MDQMRDEARALFSKWREEVETGDSTQELYDALLESALTGVAHLSQIVDKLIQQSKYIAAEARVREALALEPDNPWLLYQLGRAVLGRGQETEALTIFNQGLALNEFALIREIANDLDAKNKVLEQRRKEAQDQIAEADRLFDNGQIDSADEILAQVEQTELFPVVTYVKRANIAILLGNKDQATRFLDKAHQREARNPWVHYNRALVSEIRNDLPSALEHVEQALAHSPENANFKRTKARLEIAVKREESKILRFDRQSASHGAIKSDLPPLKVICWDLSHNPAGRAAVLAEIAETFATPEVAGPVFPRNGTSVWMPLADSAPTYDIASWTAGDMSCFVTGAIQYVLDNPCDRVWVSKARFPSLFVGCLYKLVHNAAMVVDLDDDELSFVDETNALDISEFIDAEADIDWTNPAASGWARIAEGMVGWADAVTCCNEVLQSRYGGELIRHARDQRRFAPDALNQGELRKELGLSQQDKVVLFMGTPRRHKGILEIARAVANLNDPHAILLLVGSIPEPQLHEDLKSIPGLRLRQLADRPLSDVPAMNLVADLACAYQDTSHRIAQTQTPAKLSDAAAMGTLSVTTRLQTTAPFIDAGAAIVANPGEPLVELLRRGLRLATDPSVSARTRDFFDCELSLNANAPKAQRAFKTAQSQVTALPSAFQDLLRLIQRRLPRPESPDLIQFWQRYAGQPNPPVGVTDFDHDVDVVFFWKQNDTGIYQRRQDSVHETLASLPNVRKILHIEAPISVDRLNALANPAASNGEDRLVAHKTVSRFLKAADQSDVHYRSFVTAGKETSLLGHELDTQDMFPVQVARWMEELGIGDNALAWLCPVVPEFEQVQKLIGFEDVVCDVIDDQRKWPMQPATRRNLDRAYNHAFRASDVTFSNCEPVAEWLRDEGLSPLVVPNGISVPKLTNPSKRPSILRSVDGPVIGYVGNMSDRIDWQLLDELTDARPDWMLVFIGKLPPRESAEFASFRNKPNVIMPGVVPAHQVPDWLSSMDVGIIPHLHTRLSEAMNPLKLYVYRAHGLRVVSLPVSNIGDFKDEIAIAHSVDDMQAAISDALKDKAKNGPKPMAPDKVEKYMWSTRVHTMVDQIKTTLSDKQQGT